VTGSGPSSVADDAIKAQLARILAGSALSGSPRLQQLLRYLVEEALAGRGDRLKGYTVGIEALGREVGFDPRVDPLVSIQAGRLRRALDRHYQTEGAGDPVRIQIPRGSYLPVCGPNESEERTGREALPAVLQRPSPRAPSIAVLPFTDLSFGGGNGHLAVGLAADLSLALTRFDDLRVTSPQSTLRYQGVPVDVREVGRDLGVRYVLTGSLRRDPNELNVMATLSEAATGLVAWGEHYRFEVTAANLFDAQDRITESVVSRIAGSFGVMRRALGPECLGRRTEDMDTYDAIQLVNHLETDVNAENFSRAVSALEAAIVRDPDYGLTRALLAGLYANAAALGFPTVIERPLEYALELAQRALALDPDCQRVHWNLAHVHFVRREVPECLAEIEQAIALNPNNATLLGQAGWGIALCGQWRRGMELLDKSLRLNPYHPGYFHFPRYLDRYRESDYNGALVQARLSALTGTHWDPLLQAAALGPLGRLAEAQQQGKRLLEQRPDFQRQGRALIRCYVFVDELDQRLVDGLRLAGVDVD
jgi:adenylate cyclase